MGPHSNRLRTALGKKESTKRENFCYKRSRALLAEHSESCAENTDATFSSRSFLCITFLRRTGVRDVKCPFDECWEKLCTEKHFQLHIHLGTVYLCVHCLFSAKTSTEDVADQCSNTTCRLLAFKSSPLVPPQTVICLATDKMCAELGYCASINKKWGGGFEEGQGVNIEDLSVGSHYN